MIQVLHSAGRRHRSFWSAPRVRPRRRDATTGPFGAIHEEGREDRDGQGGGRRSKRSSGCLKELGFDGVELAESEFMDASTRSWRPRRPPGFRCTAWSAVSIGRVRLNDSDPAVRAKCVEAIREAISRCEGLWGHFGPRGPGGRTEEHAPTTTPGDLSRTELLKVIPDAEAAGIDIAFENVWNNFLLSPREAAEYVDSFESDAGRVVSRCREPRGLRLAGAVDPGPRAAGHEDRRRRNTAARNSTRKAVGPASTSSCSKATATGPR